MNHILICGADPVLIAVRAKVFERHSMPVHTALSVAGLKREVTACTPSLVVLCSSLPLSERYLAIDYMSGRVARTPVLTLVRANETASLAGETLSISGGPEALIAAAQRLIAPPNESGPHA